MPGRMEHLNPLAIVAVAQHQHVRAQPGFAVRQTRLVEGPAGDGLNEVRGVFILAEHHSRLDAIDITAGRFEERQDIAAILAIVLLADSLPNGSVFDFLYVTFEDYRFVRLFGANHAVRIHGDILRLASARASAEPEAVLPPDAPDEHEVRASVWARRRDPIVVGFFEALECPAPRFETGVGVLRIFQGIRPIRPTRFRFRHHLLLREALGLRANLSKPKG
jgi:hypothetical protein